MAQKKVPQTLPFRLFIVSSFLFFSFFLFVFYYDTTFARKITKDPEIPSADVADVLVQGGGFLLESKANAVEESIIKVIHFEEVTSEENTFLKIKIPGHPNSVVIQKGVDYLLNAQNQDGSWGVSTSTKFVITAAVLDALQTFEITDVKIDKAQEWISYYFADNYDFLAQKMKIMIQAGEAPSEAEILLSGFDDESNGFIFDRGYESDSLITARAIRTLNLAGYKDSGANENATQSLAVQHLIRAKKPDLSWGVFPSGASSIPVSSEVIEAISLWKNRTLGGVVVNDTFNPAIVALKSSQSPNGSWGNNILSTAFAFHSLKFSGHRPTHELKALDYFTNNQLSNGSWNNDFYKTAKVLSALSLSTNSGNLVIKDITPTPPLETGLVANLALRVYNPGDVAISDGTLYILADNFLIGNIDLQSNNISINPGVTMNISLSLSNTRRYVGDVNFKIIYERNNSNGYLGSRYIEQLTFAPDPALRPGLPMYFAAYKNVSNNTPAITWRWPLKADPYFRNVVLFWRKLGDTTWISANVTPPTGTSATVGNLIEGQIYEATLGTSDALGNAYLSVPPVQVKVSAIASTYKIGSVAGTVKSLVGSVAGALSTGVNASSNATSGAGGAYLQINLPWGANYVKIVDPVYETFVRKVTVADNAGTAVNLLTGKKPELDITQFYARGGGDINGTRFTKTQGENVFFMTTIKNQDRAVTDPTDIGIYIDNVLYKTCALPALAKLETKTISCGPWLAALGTHSIRVVVDTKNILEEVSETNNSLTKTLDVVAGSQPEILQRAELPLY